MGSQEQTGKIAIFALAFFCAVAAVGAEQTAAPAAKRAGSLGETFRSAGQPDRGRVSIAGKRAPSDKRDNWAIFASLKDDDIFLKIGESDVLKWGPLRKHLDALALDDSRPDLRDAGNDAYRKMSFRSRFKRLMKFYIEHGVFAQEAKRAGITVDEAEFAKQRSLARARYAKNGKVGEALINLMDSEDSFFERDLTNALYWAAYRDKVLVPQVTLDDTDVPDLIALRHRKNLDIVATNAVKEATIRNLRSEILKGMDFAAAAEEYSDCESSVSGGVVMDEAEPKPRKIPKDEIHPAIWDALAKIKPGELTGVIETPYVWIFAKLLKRNPATEEDPETVEIAQIKLEKEFIAAEYSEQEALMRLRQATLSQLAKAKFAELLKTTPIDCRIPLTDAADGRRQSRIRKTKQN